MARALLAGAAIAALLLTAIVFGRRPSAYYVHRNIMATTFWVGELPDRNNAFIPNDKSAWDDHWQAHFGGVDDHNPDHRQQNGDWPAGFTPRENPYYFSLPYTEFTEDGKVKANARFVPWYSSAHPPNATYSILKNRWIKVTLGAKVIYAQWEDAGPMYYDDIAYVFGTAKPQYRPSGLDLSPAASLRLGLNGQALVSWQFVEASQVPPGPWLRIVTTRQISW